MVQEFSSFTDVNVAKNVTQRVYTCALSLITDINTVVNLNYIAQHFKNKKLTLNDGWQDL